MLDKMSFCITLNNQCFFTDIVRIFFFWILKMPLSYTYCDLIIIVPADVLAPSGARPSADSVMTTKSHIFLLGNFPGYRLLIISIIWRFWSTVGWLHYICPHITVRYLFFMWQSQLLLLVHQNAIDTVYPKKYAHGFCFAVLCCGYTLTDFPISIRLTSLALWQSNDCPSASKATLMNMDKYFIWIHYERLHNHNKAKHNKTVSIFLGIYCICQWPSCYS